MCILLSLSPCGCLARVSRENVVLNFFKRHKNIYVAFLGSQYTGEDGRGGGEGTRGRRAEEYELRTSSDAFSLLPRSARKFSAASKPPSAPGFAGYETSMKSPRGKQERSFVPFGELSRYRSVSKR